MCALYVCVSSSSAVATYETCFYDYTLKHTHINVCASKHKKHTAVPIWNLRAHLANTFLCCTYLPFSYLPLNDLAIFSEVKIWNAQSATLHKMTSYVINQYILVRTFYMMKFQTHKTKRKKSDDVKWVSEYSLRKKRQFCVWQIDVMAITKLSFLQHETKDNKILSIFYMRLSPLFLVHAYSNRNGEIGNKQMDWIG